jgi:CO dehydrogenase maturation factor
MEAGLEHLGRGTAEAVDRFIVVTEPGARSLQTFWKVKELASDLGVKDVRVVANKLRGEGDEAFLQNRLPKDALLGAIRYDEGVIEADMNGASPFELGKGAVAEIERIKEKIDAMDGNARPADEPQGESEERNRLA